MLAHSYTVHTCIKKDSIRIGFGSDLSFIGFCFFVFCILYLLLFSVFAFVFSYQFCFDIAVLLLFQFSDKSCRVFKDSDCCCCCCCSTKRENEETTVLKRNEGHKKDMSKHTHMHTLYPRLMSSITYIMYISLIEKKSPCVCEQTAKMPFPLFL